MREVKNLTPTSRAVRIPKYAPGCQNLPKRYQVTSNVTVNFMKLIQHGNHMPFERISSPESPSRLKALYMLVGSAF